jgi:glycosyltransferase A (GT-A) superfamily protein (DUF2064 family)
MLRDSAPGARKPNNISALSGRGNLSAADKSAGYFFLALAISTIILRHSFHPSILRMGASSYYSVHRFWGISRKERERARILQCAMFMKSGNGICILAKVPQIGKAKSGLERFIGNKQAALLARALLLDVIAAVLKVPQTDVFVAHWPAEAQRDFADIIQLFKIEEENENLARRADEILLIPQEGRTMKERLINISRALFDTGLKRALFICSDNPLINPLILEASFELLKSNRVVLGPTFDGSFYLLGLDGHYPRIVDSIEWRPGKIYRQLRSTLDESGMAWQELEISYDINHPEGLEQLYNDIDNLRLAGQDELCRHTEKCLANLKK